jgi:hypothetical protein
MHGRQCNKFFEKVGKYKYQRKTLTNINEVYDEINRIHSIERLIITMQYLTGIITTK